MASDDEREPGFNPKRRLCPDGGCIGIVGSDGHCSVCGRPAGGQPSQAEDAVAARPSDTIAADDDRDIDTDGRTEPGATFDPHRRLCSDGACIGVIGHDNRCQVCGKPG
jgi:hypothetical protein